MLDQLPDWVRAEVDRLPAAEVVTPLVAVPRQHHSGRTEPIHYSVQGVDRRGDVIYLRSHGLDFNIMPPSLLPRRAGDLGGVAAPRA